MDLVQKEEAMVPASSLASTAVCLERWLGRMVEVPVAVLTALEVLILLAGVISRYLFHNPLVWSDELASILFLWLAMIGAVVAFRRGEHMRMSTLVASAPPRWRAFFEAFAAAVAIASSSGASGVSVIWRVGMRLLWSAPHPGHDRS